MTIEKSISRLNNLIKIAESEEADSAANWRQIVDAHDASLKKVDLLTEYVDSYTSTINKGEFIASFYSNQRSIIDMVSQAKSEAIESASLVKKQEESAHEAYLEAVKQRKVYEKLRQTKKDNYLLLKQKCQKKIENEQSIQQFIRKKKNNL